MLQSSLPRGFLAPGLNYLGYYGDELHPYAPWHIPIEEPGYPRITESSWDATRCSTPCPLDLSLKPPATPPTHRDEENIEVEEQKDRRAEDPQTKFRREEEEQERRIIREQRPERRYEDSPLVFEDPEHSRQSHYQGYEFAKEQDEKELLAPKYQSQPGKAVPGGLSYHQQVLMTPHHLHAPMTPPSTPSPPQCPRRRAREEDPSSPMASPMTSPMTQAASTPRTEKKKKKHARRLKFDEDTSSPVSGTVILAPDEAVVTGDIDPAFNIVEVTEEARAELAKIENRLGPYQCKLCRQLHEDAFQLAQHRCSRIAHVEYRCPECDKRFSCPANLASHRRWHKPRLPSNESPTEIQCTKCDAKFTRQAALRKHLATQHLENNNNLEGREAIGKEIRIPVEPPIPAEAQ